MFKLSPIGSKINCYGYIVNAKTAHSNNRRIGYTIIIKTTITVRHQQEDLPVYIWFVEKRGRELYEWFMINHRKPAPIHVKGIKKIQKFGKTQKMDYEDAERIIWIYIRANGKITPLLNGIPNQYKNMLVY